MRIAFVIPMIFKPLIEKVIDEMKPKIEPEFVIYEVYYDAPILIHGRQKQWDAIIFAGKAGYQYCLKTEEQLIPWGFFPGEGSTLFRAMLIGKNRGWDICHLSIDSYAPKTVDDVYTDIGIGASANKSLVYVDDVTLADHNDKMLRFHLANFSSGMVSGCITRLHRVWQELEKRNIPVVYGLPTYDSVKDEVNFMLKLYLARQNTGRESTVFLFSLREQGFDGEFFNDYRYALERETLVSQIYRYAAQIGGCVIASSNNDYSLIADYDGINLSGKEFKQLSVLNSIGNSNFFSVHIGVGCGKTTQSAYSRAKQAIQRISTHPGSRAFCVLDHGRSFDISPVKPEHIANGPGEKFVKIANESGLSVSSILSVYSFVSDNRVEEFTASDLAECLKISIRSANRIVEKLEFAGYIAVTGQSRETHRGRPRRTLRLLF